MSREGFAGRLGVVLGSRRKHTWGAALGIDKSVIGEMFKGREPRSSTIIRISRAERCFANWLVDGHGPPFIISPPEHVAGGDSFASAVRSMLNYGSDRVLVLHDGVRVAICLSNYVYLDIATSEATFPEWLVLTGVLDAELASDLLSRPGVEVRSIAVLPGRLELVLAGRVGNWELFGDFGGTNPKAEWHRANQVPSFDTLPSLGVPIGTAPGPDMATTMRLAEPASAYSAPPLDQLWARIPEHRRPIALATLQMLAGDQVELPDDDATATR